MRKLLTLLLGILLFAQIAFAQSQASTGNIEGRVADPQGAAVPNVSVTARNQDTGFEKRSTQTRTEHISSFCCRREIIA